MVKHTQELINKFRAKNKAAFAQTLIKLDKLEDIEIDQLEKDRINSVSRTLSFWKRNTQNK